MSPLQLSAACQIRTSIVSCGGLARANDLAWGLLCIPQENPGHRAAMSYDILKNLGLDQLDTQSPDFLKTLERLQREALQSLQAEDLFHQDARAEMRDR